jgi:hypothetical protein
MLLFIPELSLMSVKDKIKLFEKSTAFKHRESPPRSPSSPSARVPSPPSASQFTLSERLSPPQSVPRHPGPIPDDTSPVDSITDSQMTSPPRDVSPRLSCKDYPPPIQEDVYYEIDSEFIQTINEYCQGNSIDHTIILNKPLFPKPCLYTE